MRASVLRTAFALTAALVANGAAAQQGKAPAAPDPDEQPALMTSPDAHAPAVKTAPSGSSAAAAAPKVAGQADKRDEAGSTIIGERESPIGLYITPWRNSYAEQDIDRPARLLQVDMSPVDRVVFGRQVAYYEALTAARAKKSAPPAPAAPGAAPSPPPAPTP